MGFASLNPSYELSVMTLTITVINQHGADLGPADSGPEDARACRRLLNQARWNYGDGRITATAHAIPAISFPVGSPAHNDGNEPRRRGRNALFVTAITADRPPRGYDNHHRAQGSTSRRETDMNCTAKQSDNSAAKQSNEIRSLNDEEIDVASGGMSDFMWEVTSAIRNWAILASAGYPHR